APTAAVQQIVAVLSERGNLCARCLAHDARLVLESVRQAVDAIGSHIRTTATPGTCPECGQEDFLLSFDGAPPTDWRSGRDHGESTTPLVRCRRAWRVGPIDR